MTTADLEPMNFKHAIGFMVVGAVFGLLPTLAPSWCPATGVDGSSTRALWLEVMSTVLITIAMAHFGRRILASVATLLEQGRRVADEATPAFEMPSAEEVATLVARRRPAPLPMSRSPLPLPVAFGPALAESQRAA